MQLPTAAVAACAHAFALGCYHHVCICLAKDTAFPFAFDDIDIACIAAYACFASFVRVVGAYVTADVSLYTLLHPAGVVVAFVAAFVGSAAPCAVLFPVAG